MSIDAARRFLLSALIAVSMGCATVSSGWPVQRVSVTSNPPAAALVADGEPVGVTPVTIPAKRRYWWGDSGVMVFRFEKEGFSPTEFQVEPGLNRKFPGRARISHCWCWSYRFRWCCVLATFAG